MEDIGLEEDEEGERNMADLSIDLSHPQTDEVVQRICRRPSTYVHRVRRRTGGGGKGDDDEQTVEQYRQVGGKEYEMLRAERRTDIGRILKRRLVFLDGCNYFELDCIREPHALAGRCMLSVEVEDDFDDVSLLNLPPSWRILKEVTGKEEFKSHYMASL